MTDIKNVFLFTLAGLVSLNAFAVQNKFKTFTKTYLSVGNCVMTNIPNPYGPGFKPQAGLTANVCQEYVTYDPKTTSRTLFDKIKINEHEFDFNAGTKTHEWDAPTETFDDVMVYHPNSSTNQPAIAVSVQCEQRREEILQLIANQPPNLCSPMSSFEAQEAQ